MSPKMVHVCIHVLDLEKSIAFYKEAFDLVPVREKGPEDGSFKLVFLANEASDFQLELTWNEGRVEPYNQGGHDIHLAFAAEDLDAMRAKHEAMGIVSFVNEAMGIYFVEDPDGFFIEVIPA